MTKFRKSVLVLAVAAAVTVPVGAAYAAGGSSPARGPAPGMTQGSGPTANGTMDPADCEEHYAEHHARMGQHNGDMTRMREQMHGS